MQVRATLAGEMATPRDETPTNKILPLPADGLGSFSYWTEQIEQSKTSTKQTREQFTWQAHVDRYVGKGSSSALTTDTVLLPKDYSYTEQKKALLFYQTPQVMLMPARPDVTPEIANLFEAVLNDLTGPTRLNCKATIDECLIDLLVPAGIGIAKIGYEAFLDKREPEVDMQVGEEPVVDPILGPMTDPTTGLAMMRPVYEKVPNVVRERYFCSRVSPLDFLFDPSFRGSDWTRARWLGIRFRLPQLVSEAMFGKGRDARREASSAQQPSPEQSLTPDKTAQMLGGVEGTEIYYYAMDVDPAVSDPDLIRVLVMLDGQSEPVKHENCPYQQVENNKVVGGLRRFPIYPLTLRYVSDTAIPPSDCAMSRVIVDELSKGRTQMLQQRDRNIPMRGVDITKISPAAREMALKGNFQQILPLENLSPGESPFHAIPQSAFPQENFNFNNYGERDLQECWGLGSNNLGSTNSSGRTATELSIMQQATDTRMEADRTRVLQWWTSIVEGLAALVQQYATETEYVNVLGPDGAKTLQPWNSQKIAGEYAFSMRPDSARRVDQAAERKFRLDVYNLFANNQLVNQQELLRWVAPALGFDPGKMIAQPKDPEPEPPKMSIAIAGDDLAPAMPQFPNVEKLLATRGIQLQPPQQPQGVPGAPPQGAGALQAAQTATPVSKHGLDQTGQLPGAGQATRPN